MKTLVPVMFLLQTAKRYDTLLTGEIRDESETTDDEFLDAINKDIGFVSSLVATLTFTNFHFLRFFGMYYTVSTDVYNHCTVFLSTSFLKRRRKAVQYSSKCVVLS